MSIQDLVYDIKNKEFKSTVKKKAVLFLENGCVRIITRDRFMCLPIKDYNKTTYHIINYNNHWECNCQGFQKNKICSHIIAVKMFIQGWKP